MAKKKMPVIKVAKKDQDDVYRTQKAEVEKKKKLRRLAG